MRAWLIRTYVRLRVTIWWMWLNWRYRDNEIKTTNYGQVNYEA